VTLVQLESLVAQFDPRVVWSTATLMAYLDVLGSRVKAGSQAWGMFDFLTGGRAVERGVVAQGVAPSSALYTRMLHALAFDWQPEFLAHLDTLQQRMLAPDARVTTFSATQKTALRRAFAEHPEALQRLEQHFSAKRLRSNATPLAQVPADVQVKPQQ